MNMPISVKDRLLAIESALSAAEEVLRNIPLSSPEKMALSFSSVIEILAELRALFPARNLEKEREILERIEAELEKLDQSWNGLMSLIGVQARLSLNLRELKRDMESLPELSKPEDSKESKSHLELMAQDKVHPFQ